MGELPKPVIIWMCAKRHLVRRPSEDPQHVCVWFKVFRMQTADIVFTDRHNVERVPYGNRSEQSNRIPHSVP